MWITPPFAPVAGTSGVAGLDLGKWGIDYEIYDLNQISGYNYND